MAIPLANTMYLPLSLRRHKVITSFSKPPKSGTRKTTVLLLRTGAVPTRNDSTTRVFPEILVGKRVIEAAEKSKRLLADRWRDVHGQDDWAGMLDPIDPLLRSELLRYGEMAQACYDAFDDDPYSKYCGSCVAKPKELFSYLGWTRYGYNVTRYLHATYNVNLPYVFKKSFWPDGWSPTANWIGYVAVSDDETSAYLGRRDIVIAWRGTSTGSEWLANLTDFLRPISRLKIPSPDPKVKVEAGFVRIYTDHDTSCKFSEYSAREQILTEISHLIRKYGNEEVSITITGHSLGSSLAIINAYDIAETGLDITDDGRVVPICVYSFGGPRVGNVRFKERLDGLGVKVLRVVNVHDRVPTVPGIFCNEHVPVVLQKILEKFPWSYSHVGEEIALDHKKSPFLKEIRNPADFHNLEMHLHMIDGYHGKDYGFGLTSKRDFALVNKAGDLLKRQFLVPPNWWRKEKRGLGKNNPMGFWRHQECRDLEEHLLVEDSSSPPGFLI